MTAICDDLEYEIRTIRPTPQNTLFASVWSHHDTDYGGNYPIHAVSFHTSQTQRTEFHNELYASYAKQWGKKVPPSYYGSYNKFEVISSPELLDFTTQMINLNKLGIVVLIPTLKYLPRLGLTQPSADMDQLIIEHGSDFKEQLMTHNKLLAEIKEDTILWYRNLQNPPYDTGWITIK